MGYNPNLFSFADMQLTFNQEEKKVLLDILSRYTKKDIEEYKS
jgi:hypothetical protein